MTAITSFKLIVKIAGSEKLTLRQTAARIAAGMTDVFVFGKPDHIADILEEWFRAGACDRFMVSPLVAPYQLEEFVDRVIPLLRQRGLFRSEYEATTLRGNLGLSSLFE